MLIPEDLKQHRFDYYEYGKYSAEEVNRSGRNYCFI